MKIEMYSHLDRKLFRPIWAGIYDPRLIVLLSLNLFMSLIVLHPVPNGAMLCHVPEIFGENAFREYF